jgi:hypothetical protein
VFVTTVTLRGSMKKSADTGCGFVTEFLHSKRLEKAWEAFSIQANYAIIS